MSAPTPEPEIEIDLDLCAADPHMVKCPRCLRWHGTTTNTPYPTDKLIEGGYDPARLILCDRCEGVLVEGYLFTAPAHDVALEILVHRALGRDPYRRGWRVRVAA